MDTDTSSNFDSQQEEYPESDAQPIINEKEKTDANDYSRFDDVEASDSDDEPLKSGEVDKLSLTDSLVKASRLKDEGNLAFKNNDLINSMINYEAGLEALKPYIDSKSQDISKSDSNSLNTVLVSLYGNKAMVAIKQEDWRTANLSATKVLNIEPENVKALYRRAVASSKLGYLDESKNDLLKTLELDPTNAPAKKELVELNKLLKEHQKKQKAAFTGMFSRTSVYDDKEKERENKLKKEEEEKEKQRDEWTQSKLQRREQGLEEQTFEEWKEEMDKKKKEEEEEKKRQEEKKRRTDQPSTKSKLKKKSSAATADHDYDEEDQKIINETKSKGYCYFNSKPSEEVKNLIGDITPKSMHKSLPNPNTVTDTSLPNSAPPPLPTDSYATTPVAASSWNHAGTWEERDLTRAAKDRLTELLSTIDISSSPRNGTESSQDTDQLISALQGMDVAKLGEDPMQALQRMNMLLASVKSKITKVVTVEGDAQIVLARNKKRHIFDFTIELEFEITIDSSIPSSISGSSIDENSTQAKAKKFKGTISLIDVTPHANFDSTLKFKKPIPAEYQTKVNDSAKSLQNDIREKIKLFETEFKNM